MSSDGHCNLCGKKMSLFARLSESDGKKCHMSCKEHMERQWKKIKDLDRK